MKKLLLILLLAVVEQTVSATGTVYLRNGSVVKGEIIEYIPNQTIKVRTSDGNLFTWSHDEIEKVTGEETDEEVPKNNRGNKRGRKAKPPYVSPLDQGYSGQVTTEFFAGHFIGFTLATTHGFQFKDLVFVGVGGGLRHSTIESLGNLTVPVFANVRIDAVSQKVSPILSVRAGRTIPLSEAVGGFYGTFDLGVRLKRMMLSFGLETACGREFEYEWRNDEWGSHRDLVEENTFRGYCGFFRLGVVF